ncbi:heat-inducible transcriptional repressor HrcA [Granulibacter bethesdensis]|uniref:Heat-inducible transcription repressor HrcA n=1 Tax=Granulibacter bethesdensis (strain ATCC BAA-1260 / CGDNIH1) TaxID=391165 RepID=Q0BW80_GRABC|nr:heat-inducible transcriptional repressor HrcA [Granulibacter bethesdensis]ABI60922.1 Heat-inducible transcription repressor hrcA [Granulibacter bethesdensis CGDNIH1]APH50686.1 Heat-inducible transcription repressor hrcA [Granulibacter bethesdensis]APH63381.1 Heat-inducible transcription repressor hrcA [Granulibacter bethesdensis]
MPRSVSSPPRGSGLGKVLGASLPVSPLPAGLPAGLDTRSAAILREIVEQYVETGEPVGSRTLSRRLPVNLSPATIRNVMADLTDAGLLFAPHTSAGRLPTDRGLRLFVDGLLQFGALSEDEQNSIAASLEARGRSLEDTLTEASTLLSGLSSAAGLVLAPKSEGALRHIEFVPLSTGRALVIMVTSEGQVENRVMEIPPGLPPSALQQAANYLNARLSNKPLADLRRLVTEEITANRTQLDTLAAQVVEAGLATWSGEERGGNLIVRGQGKLLADAVQAGQLAAIQMLFDQLEAQETILRLLDLAENSDGVRIFIGAESGLFGASGLSMVVAPARNEANRIVGAIGVIGPTRINYGRIIPVVDYTARVIGRLLGGAGQI